MSYMFVSVRLSLPLQPYFDSFCQFGAVTVNEGICPFLPLIVPVSQEKRKIKERERDPLKQMSAILLSFFEE